MTTTRVTLCFAVGLALVTTVACREPEPSNTIRVSGHVEATEVQVAPDVGGRLLELRLAEGDRVAVGDLVGRLDTRDVDLQITRARAEREAADAQLRLLQAGARPEEIRQAEAQRDAVEAEVAGAAAQLQAAVLDLERFEALLKANAGSQKQRDDAKARLDTLRERQRGARERVRVAREALARVVAPARPEEVGAARTRIGVVTAQLAQLEKSVDDAVVKSPSAGIVTQDLVEAGEIVAPRTPLVVVTDLDRAWANAFVPEPAVPRIKLGQAASVHTDAGQMLQGTVTFVSSRAEFTPRNVQTAEERSRLVYRIKVSVDNSAGILKQGMPVDVTMVLP